MFVKNHTAGSMLGALGCPPCSAMACPFLASDLLIGPHIPATRHHGAGRAGGGYRMVFPLDSRVRERDLVEEARGVDARAERVEGERVLRSRPCPLRDVRHQSLGERDQVEIEAGARAAEGEARGPDDGARRAGEKKRDRALVERLAEPHAGEGWPSGGHPGASRERRRRVIDGLLVGEHDRLVLVPSHGALALDAVQLHVDLERCGRHVASYARTTNWCGARGTRTKTAT